MSLARTMASSSWRHRRLRPRRTRFSMLLCIDEIPFGLLRLIVSLLVLTVHIVTIFLGINLGRYIIFSTPSRRVAAFTLCSAPRPTLLVHLLSLRFSSNDSLFSLLFIF
jgi:hypothetical protein